MEIQLLKDNRDEFIENNKGFIYNTAYKVCKRKLDWRNDDELSISLIAFNNACNSYKNNKGNFYSYASVLIKNALIDSFRKAKNTPFLIFDTEDDTIEYVDTKNSLIEFEKSLEAQQKAEEIALFSKELAQYKISFSDLVTSSPSHKDTRDMLLNLAVACIKEESILNSIKTKKVLPIKEIILLTNTNRKFIENWRRYILALILILSTEEYPYIKSYLNIKVGDSNE